SGGNGRESTIAMLRTELRRAVAPDIQFQQVLLLVVEVDSAEERLPHFFRRTSTHRRIHHTSSMEFMDGIGREPEPRTAESIVPVVDDRKSRHHIKVVVFSNIEVVSKDILVEQAVVEIERIGQRV